MTIPRDPSDRDALAGQILGGYLAGWEPDELGGLLSDLTGGDDMGDAKKIWTCIPHGYHSSAGPCPKCTAQAVWHACPDCREPAGFPCRPRCTNPSGGRGKHSQFPEVTP